MASSLGTAADVGTANGIGSSGQPRDGVSGGPISKVTPLDYGARRIVENLIIQSSAEIQRAGRRLSIFRFKSSQLRPDESGLTKKMSSLFLILPKPLLITATCILGTTYIPICRGFFSRQGW